MQASTLVPADRQLPLSPPPTSWIAKSPAGYPCQNERVRCPPVHNLRRALATATLIAVLAIAALAQASIYGEWPVNVTVTAGGPFTSLGPGVFSVSPGGFRSLSAPGLGCGWAPWGEAHCGNSQDTPTYPNILYSIDGCSESVEGAFTISTPFLPLFVSFRSSQRRDAAPDTQCRASLGDCDPAEFCTGSSGSCPDDERSLSVCRQAAGLCDVAEQCDGISPDCPSDLLLPAGAICRAVKGDCDLEELCTGTVDCPPDSRDGSTVCRPSTAACDPAEQCDGAHDDCPADTNLLDDDADGTCEDIDDCPGVANQSQSDIDGDGQGDACDPADATANLTLVKLIQSRPGAATGSIALKGDLLTTPPFDKLAPANGLALQIIDGFRLDYRFSWVPGECTATSSGQMKCKSADKRKTITLKPLASIPELYLFRASLRRVALDGPFQPPVQVDIATNGDVVSGTDRWGSLGLCVISNSGMRCRVP